MQFTLLINQVKALEWGLNAQQSMLYAFLYELSSWADAIEVGGITYYRISKSKIIRELPLLTDKPDTVYRLLKQLRMAGLVEIDQANGGMVLAITDKGRMWNKSGEALGDPGTVDMPAFSVDKARNKIRGSEKSPSKSGKKSGAGSEKNPTYHITNKSILPDQSGGAALQAVGEFMAPLADQIAAEREIRCRDNFELFCKAYPKDPYGDAAWEIFCEISPDDDLLGWMLRAIGHQRVELAWHRDDKRWVPKPEKWLRQARWKRSPGARVDQYAKGAKASGSENNPVIGHCHGGRS